MYRTPALVSVSPLHCTVSFKRDSDAEAYKKEVINSTGKNSAQVKVNHMSKMVEVHQTFKL